MDIQRDEETGLVPRLVAGVAQLGHRFPWLVLAITVLSCGLCLWYTGIHLTYETQRNDLHGKDKAYYQRWQEYVKEFGDDDDMVVVVRGTHSANQRTEMVQALEDLAGQIGQKPDLYDRLFYKVDLRSLRNRALLFLAADQIRLIQDNLQDLKLLLEPPFPLAGLDPFFAWKSLNLMQLLHEGERRAMALAGNSALAPDSDLFLKQLNVICRTAGSVLDNPAAYKNPWQSILPEQPQQQDLMAEPQFFFSGDGTLAFLLVRPYKEKEGFTFAQKSIDGLRALIAQTAPRFPGLEFGLTGLPVLENDEMVASQNDSNLAGWLALAGVAVLYLVVYRGIRYPFMTVMALLVGTAWALGWTTLTVGHLNILSSAFAVMLIGMGDYGVLWVTRFGEERRAGADLPEAMRKTAFNVGPSILTAALATALAFYAAMLADLKAVAELGWIAGSGVLLCACSCFVVMPPLLTILDKRFKTTRDVDTPTILSLKEHQADHRPWLPALSKRPRWVIVASLAGTLVLAYFALQIRYDHNLLKLQAQDLESVRWEQTLIAHTAGASWHALSYTTTPEEVIALKTRYEKLPEVSRVVEVASLVPRDQDHKLEQLQDIQKRLRNLPKRGALLPHGVPEPEEIRRTARSLRDLLAPWQHSPLALDLAGNLQQLIQRLGGADADLASRRLQEFEQFLARDLAEDLHRLKDVTVPVPIKVADLPECLRERYISKNGKWLLRIFAKDCLWDYGPLKDFVSQVRTVDADATGKPFTTLEGLKAMKNGFLWAGLYALVAMVLVLLLDFGNVKHTLIALLPLGMGLVATLGLMVLAGYSLNPANMIAFPLILGVGADNGVHVLHDYRGRGKGKSYFLASSTGRGIMVAALTTILGFGTLMIASHRGLASLGLILTLGVTCCMLTALVFLPALLSFRRQIAAAPPIIERKREAA
jgi:hopanoid biosynthesis associated RND transporter like protein HpnN